MNKHLALPRLLKLLIFTLAVIGLGMAASSFGRAVTIDLTHDQLTWQTYNPAQIVVTANKLIALGPQNAYASLLQFAEKPVDGHQPMEGSNRDYDVAWLCLLIYDPKPDSGLPWPEFGGPAFPETGAFLNRPDGRMNSAVWPRFPLALSRGVPFLLVEGYYMLGGLAEPGRFFLKRCQANGVFHTTWYPIPNHAEAEAALKSLISSPEWKALAWHESTSPPYLHDRETREIEFLRQQVERVHKISYGPGWQICFFDRPGSFQNVGSKAASAFCAAAKAASIAFE